MALLERQLQEAASSVDQKLFRLSSQIDCLTTQFSLEKDSREFLNEI